MENKTFTALQVNTGLGQSAQASFYVSGTGLATHANVYGSNVVGSPLTQPIATDANGQVSVWSPNGDVDVEMVPSVGATKLIENVTFYDVVDDTSIIKTISSVGSGSPVYDAAASSGSMAAFKSVAAGANVTVTDSGTTLTIASSNPGGTVTGGANEGGAHTVLDTGASTSSTLIFKTIAAGANVTVTDSGSVLTLAANTGGGTLNPATNGYQVFPSGLVIQWGQAAMGSVNTNVPVVFPVAFNNAFLHGNFTGDHNDGLGDSQNSINSPTTTGMNLVPTVSGNTTLYWFAIGH